MLRGGYALVLLWSSSFLRIWAPIPKEKRKQTTQPKAAKNDVPSRKVGEWRQDSAPRLAGITKNNNSPIERGLRSCCVMLARHVSSCCPCGGPQPPHSSRQRRKKENSRSHSFGCCCCCWCCRSLVLCPLSLGLVNTAPNCRLNFSLRVGPGRPWNIILTTVSCLPPKYLDAHPATRPPWQLCFNFIFEVVAVRQCLENYPVGVNCNQYLTVESDSCQALETPKGLCVWYEGKGISLN